jgi:TPR repeat protein
VPLGSLYSGQGENMGRPRMQFLLTAAIAVTLAGGSALAAEVIEPDLLLEGLTLSFGHSGMAQDYLRGKELLEQACVDGRSAACGSWSWRRPEGPEPSAVVAHFEPACRDGDPVACLPAAWVLLDPAYETPDATLGQELLQTSCDLGLPEGCAELALAGLRGTIPMARLTSIDLLSQACTDGSGTACAALAQEDTSASNELADRACALDSLWGCAILAEAEIKSSQTEKGLALHKMACDDGYLGSCLALGQRYSRGDGVAADPKQALRIFERSCQWGDSKSCEEAGTMLLSGTLVPADPTAAWGLIQEGCTLGDVDQCRQVVAYGPPFALSDAAFVAVAQTLTNRCLHQDNAACGSLGLANVLGAGVPQDIDWGLDVLGRSCTEGDAASCQDLGKIHTFGAGVDADKSTARGFYLQACQAGLEESCRALPKRMRPDVAADVPKG